MTQSGESHAYTLDLCSGGFQHTSELLFATMLSLQMPKTSHWSWYLILTFRGKKAIKLAFTCSCDWPINILQNILPERYNLRTGNVTREFSCNHSKKKKKVSISLPRCLHCSANDEVRLNKWKNNYVCLKLHLLCTPES